jgi:hypothetical protein
MRIPTMSATRSERWVYLVIITVWCSLRRSLWVVQQDITAAIRASVWSPCLRQDDDDRPPSLVSIHSGCSHAKGRMERLLLVACLVLRLVLQARLREVRGSSGLMARAADVWTGEPHTPAAKPTPPTPHSRDMVGTMRVHTARFHAVPTIGSGERLAM